MFDILIIGSGISGMTAAIYALRAGLNVAIVEKSMYGGQMSITSEIENYPGISKIGGFDLSKSIYDQVKELGCKFIFEEVKSVSLTDNIKIIETNNQKLESRSVIICVGIKRRMLNCPGEKEFAGRGVSYCATCDGAFFKNKDVVIVGGGNTALEDALYLSNICNKIYMIVRKPSFRGEKLLVDAVKSRQNIKILTEHTVEKIVGENTISSVMLNDSSKNQSNSINVQGVFVAIGYTPDTSLFSSQVDVTNDGYFSADETCKTNLNGVFVAGDCRDKPLRQLVTASSDGAVAATAAIEFINKLSDRI